MRLTTGLGCSVALPLPLLPPREPGSGEPAANWSREVSLAHYERSGPASEVPGLVVGQAAPEEEQKRWEVGYRAGIALADGEPSNDMPLPAALFARYRRRFGAAWAFEGLVRYDEHLTDWDVRDRNTGARGEVDDYGVLVFLLGFAFGF